MKNILLFSIFINLLFIVIGGYIIHHKGGFVAINRILKEVFQAKQNGNFGSYYASKTDIFETLPIERTDIVFLGNSITEYCNWSELFGMSNIKNRGIGGDIIKGVINRIDQVVDAQPQKIFLMIGVNDLELGNSVEEILTNYEALVQIIVQKSPSTQLYIQSTLPTRGYPNRKNSDIIKINAGIEAIAAKYNSTYIQLFDLFKAQDGKLKTELTYDGLHINGEGYLIWKKVIIDYVVN